MATHPGPSSSWQCWPWGAPPARVPRRPPGPAGAQALGLFFMSSTSASTISLTSSCKEGERQMRAPAQGTNERAARRERPGARRAPPAPRSRTRRGRGFAGLFPPRPRPQPRSVCRCGAVHRGCPSLPWWLLSSKQEPGQGHRKWDFSMCPSHATQRFPPPFPSLSGTKHTRKATHIKRDSWLPVQLLSGFGTVPLQKILRKRRERCCEKRPPSPPRWPLRCSCFPASRAWPRPPLDSSEDKIFLFKM